MSNLRNYRQPIILAFCLLAILTTFVGNLYRTVLYKETLPITQYFFGPLGLWQYGWGMYSFDLHTHSPIRYAYAYADGTTQYYVSPYGHVASPVRTELGNFDVMLAADQTGNVALPVLAYYCSHPQVPGDQPVSVSLQAQRLPIPTFQQPKQPNASLPPYVNLYTKSCSNR